jgi:hypothetical protein
MLPSRTFYRSLAKSFWACVLHGRGHAFFLLCRVDALKGFGAVEVRK